jgi:hypothetical protein
LITAPSSIVREKSIVILDHHMIVVLVCLGALGPALLASALWAGAPSLRSRLGFVALALVLLALNLEALSVCPWGAVSAGLRAPSLIDMLVLIAALSAVLTCAGCRGGLECE